MAKQAPEMKANGARLSEAGYHVASTSLEVPQNHSLAVLQAFFLTVLAAIYLPISQLCLSPVYGSAQAELYRRWTILALIQLSFLSTLTRYPFPSRYIACWAFSMPMLHFLLFRISGTLGTLGPAVTEIVTYHPLAFLSLHAAARRLEVLGDATSKFLGTGLLYVIYILVENIAREYVPKVMGLSVVFTRVGLQTLVAILYTLVIHSSLLWPATLPILFTLLVNPHTPLPLTTALLKYTLQQHNYTLLARQESTTGYISVLENTELQFRVMRCDHSLLGGEWTMPPPTGHHPRVAEPIYAVFTMLEAVRLIESNRPANAPLSALNIGLGIGTAPSALIAHGVNTTILELDPVVYQFAKDHFSLPSNHTAHITDAVDWVTIQSQSPAALKYDFLIHDVFTGGAEPISLFTYEFFTSLAQLLKEDGAIAINYAGNLKSPAPALVYHTITQVFQSCTIYRETLPPEPNYSESESQSDFTNLVIFCTQSPERLTFRKAIEPDYLGSGARQEWLQPKAQHHVDQAVFGEYDPEKVLRKNSRAIKELEKLQTKSAIGHWKVMRTVIPDVVWENW